MEEECRRATEGERRAHAVQVQKRAEREAPLDSEVNESVRKSKDAAAGDSSGLNFNLSAAMYLLFFTRAPWAQEKITQDSHTARISLSAIHI